MALPVRQTNDDVNRTYEDIFYGSEDIFAPFEKESTPRQIQEKLQKLHSDAAEKHLPSEIIKTLLENRKKWLQKIIAYIDIAASPRSLNWEFISDLRVDFSRHIDAVIRTMPAPDKYIGNSEKVKNAFSKAGSALDDALDALEGLGELKDIETEEKIKEKDNAYTALHTATYYFEEGLSKWDILPARPEGNQVDELGLEGYLKLATTCFKEQLEAIENTWFSLKFPDTALPPAEKKLEEFELLLRKQVLATLLEIPEQPMPGDNKSQEYINDSGIHTYISYKSDVIKDLRTAKIALNLALDRYKLIKPPARMKRGYLNTHIDSCTTSLGTILDKLCQK